jgi:hypothetical protein
LFPAGCARPGPSDASHYRQVESFRAAGPIRQVRSAKF